MCLIKKTYTTNHEHGVSLWNVYKVCKAKHCLQRKEEEWTIKETCRPVWGIILFFFPVPQLFGRCTRPTCHQPQPYSPFPFSQSATHIATGMAAGPDIWDLPHHALYWCPASIRSCAADTGLNNGTLHAPRQRNLGFWVVTG